MGFEDLAQELARHAEAESKKLLSAAERSAGKIEDEAKEKAEESVRAAKKDASSYVKQESSERLTSAKLSAKKIVDESRDEAVDASLRQVWSQFKSDSLRKSSYPQLLAQLVGEGMREIGATDVVVYVREEDKPLVSGYRTSALPKEYSGGAIVESSNGKIRVNKTLEEVFAQKKSALRKQIYDKLF
jgi:vacuolar-type H+-ATPase subunit E/Vma4